MPVTLRRNHRSRWREIRSFADGREERYVWDQGPYGLGRLTRIETWLGGSLQATLAYSYDRHGRVLGETRSEAGRQATTSRTWSNGALASLTTPAGLRLDYARDPQGRISAIDLTVQGLTRRVVGEITYHPFGDIKSYRSGASGPLLSQPRDLDGRPSGFSLGGQTWNLGYDAAGRIVSLAGSGSAGFGYDLADRLTSASGGGLDFAYAYDAAGNRTAWRQGATLETTALDAASHRIAQRGDIVYQYDANGSVLDDAFRGYAYDARGRLATVESADPADPQALLLSQYRYDPLGRREGKMVGNRQWAFSYDAQGHLLEEATSEAGATGTTVTTTYLWLGDLPVGLWRDGLFFIDSDHLGTPRLVRDEAQQVRWRHSPLTEPFGASWAEEDPQGTGNRFEFNLAFPGQYRDRETGLNYNFFRDYDPATGRYVQSDPIGLAGGSWSTYTYVGDDPMSRTDPLGLAWRDVIDAQNALNCGDPDMFNANATVKFGDTGNDFGRTDASTNGITLSAKDFGGNLNDDMRDQLLMTLAHEYLHTKQSRLSKLATGLDDLVGEPFGLHNSLARKARNLSDKTRRAYENRTSCTCPAR